MEKDLETLRHSTSHVLASAVLELFPETKLGIGPAIEDGFYYDFDLKHTLTPEDLEKLEKKMKEIINKNLRFEKKEVTKKEAEKLFKDQPYKLELINELKGKITIYKHGDFIDLCSGPHINYTKGIKAFKLLKLSGAYWKGDSKNKQLQRIYGTSFQNKEQLETYLKNQEEAKKRDHRVLGEQLNLFMFHEFSPGAPFFLPNGTIIYNELMKFVREQYKKRGYQEVITPLLYEKKLWETSGHWEHYHENMFNLEIEKRTFSLKPMNCPSHCLIYKNKLYSYKELPLRIADFAPLHRNELSGTLGGLTRVRKMSQDDSHIFVAEEQLEEEINNVIEFEKFIYRDTFKFEFSMVLSTRPESFMGEIKLWDKAEKLLESVLKKNKINYAIAHKDGAFYGPKIDMIVKDSLGRDWQLATIQLDFQLPLRFNLTYEGKDSKKHTPIMIHRAIIGSFERFMGLLIETYAGKFPLWLTPIQVKIITVTDRHISYANKLKQELENNNIRTELDERPESIGKKIVDAHKDIPFYIITIGDKEISSNILAVRTRENKVINVEKDKFMESLIKDIKNRA